MEACTLLYVRAHEQRPEEGGLIKARPALARARAQARFSLINSGRAPTDTLPGFLTEVTCENALARTYTRTHA